MADFDRNNAVGPASARAHAGARDRGRAGDEMEPAQERKGIARASSGEVRANGHQPFGERDYLLGAGFKRFLTVRGTLQQTIGQVKTTEVSRVCFALLVSLRQRMAPLR
jgi:hypothetical protein